MFSLKVGLAMIKDVFSERLTKAINNTTFDIYHFALLVSSLFICSQFLVAKNYSGYSLAIAMSLGVLISAVYLLKKEYANFFASVSSYIALVSLSLIYPYFSAEIFTKVAIVIMLVSMLPLTVIAYNLQKKSRRLSEERMRKTYQDDLDKMQVINLCEGRLKNLEALKKIDLKNPFSDNFKLSHGVSIVMVGKYFYVVLSLSGWDLVILTRHKTLENAKNDKEIIHKFADNFLDRPKEFGKGLTQFLSMRHDYFKLDDDTVKTLKEITWFALIEMAQKNQKSFRADSETMDAMSAVDRSNKNDMDKLKQEILSYNFLVVVPDMRSLKDLSKIPGTLVGRPDIPYKFRGGAIPLNDKFYCYISVFGTEIVVINTFASKSMAKHYLESIAKELGPEFFDSPEEFAKKVVQEGIKNQNSLPCLSQELKENISSFYKNALIEELDLGGAEFPGRVAN